MDSSITSGGSYPITNEELIAMFRPRRKEAGSSKCLVYTFATLIFLLTVLLVIASTVMRLRIPEVELRSPKLMHISYRTSPSPSFNVSMVVHVTIKNTNFVGGFVYEENSVSVLYRGARVGVGIIGRGRVKAGETKQMKLALNMRSHKLLVSEILATDLRSGILKFRSYAKLGGTEYLLKVLKKRTITVMACTMYLNLTSHSVHHFQC